MKQLLLLSIYQNNDVLVESFESKDEDRTEEFSLT